MKSDREKASKIMSLLLKERKNTSNNSIRIGISGPPGVGKSMLLH